MSCRSDTSSCAAPTSLPRSAMASIFEAICCPCSTASQWSPATTLLCTNSQRISMVTSPSTTSGCTTAKDLIVAEICSILSTRLGYCRGALKLDKLFHGISHGGTSRIQSGVDKLVSIVGLNKEVYCDYAAKGLLISVFRFNQWGWNFLQQVLYILNI